MGIDALVSLIAFIGIVIAIAGVGLAAYSRTQNRNMRGGVALIGVGVVLWLVFSIVAEGLLVVGPTQRAVVFNNLSGNLEDEPRNPGLHVIIPGIQQSFIYQVSRQEYTMSGIPGEGAVANNDAIEARSVDGQEVFMDITIIFFIEPGDADLVHENWSDVSQGYTVGLIRPTVRSIARDVVAGFQAEQIYGASREAVQREIEARVTAALEPEGFNVVSILLREINFSDAFINAIEAKQVEEQQLERAETEALRVQTEARGRAEAAIEEARGEAESVRIRAEAEADALRVVSEQIAANPNLIQYQYIQTLSDNVTLALIPSNSPFLFDPSTFTELGADFQAPESSGITLRSDNENNDGSPNNNE